MSIKNLNELKNSIDIVDIIGNHVPLKTSGSNYAGLCPFHDENSPSFLVSKIKGIYHCFGCDASGDAIKFIMEYLKLDFIDAIKHIAKMCNFSLEFSTNEHKDNTKQTNEEFLNHCLKRNSHIMEYMQKRGFSKETIKEFNIGLCGENFELSRDIKDKKVALELGILKEYPNGYTSIFSKRLILPIFSSSGQIAGFVGRSLDNTMPKYINSKESRFYKKASILYGYNKTKLEIAKKKEALIVEGYLDCLSLYEAGIKNAVAICGTALSKEHISLIQKLDSKIILALDNDNAGLSATKRAIELLLVLEIYDSYVAIFDSKQKDCNDMLLYDKQALLNYKKVSIIEYYIRTFIYKDFENTANSPEVRYKIQDGATKFLNTIKSDFLRSEYANFCNELFGITFSIEQSPKKQLFKNVFDTKYRILKAVLENDDYRIYLAEYAKAQDFDMPQEQFINILNNVITKELAQILFNENIKSYPNKESFIKDFRFIIKNARIKELRQNPNKEEILKLTRFM